MHPRTRSCQMDGRGNRRDSRAPLPWLLSLAACALSAAAGCEEEARHVQSRPGNRAAAQTGINVDIDVEDRSSTQARPQPPPAEPVRAHHRPADERDPQRRPRSCKRGAPRSPRQRSKRTPSQSSVTPTCR